MCIQCIGMCGYCDCRNLPVISRLSKEHAFILRTADELRQALERDDEDRRPAEELLDQLLAMLLAHGSYEERSLYREMRADSAFEETVDDLCAEHGEIYGALRHARRVGPDRESVLPQLDRLHRHILKEEQGLFPPAVILLSTSAWERVAASA